MKHLFTILLLCISIGAYTQETTTILEGYIYETGNRGYLENVSISVEYLEDGKIIKKLMTDEDGFFSLHVPVNSNLRLYATKTMFDIKKIDIIVKTKKVFAKLEMGRTPGYKFEVTLAEKRDPDAEIVPVDAIRGARIEVYNNTKRLSLLDLKDHALPEFQMKLEKGNHYTILIRKDGYLSKRMEAKVNVEGCILCFEGVGRVDPGVADNLTDGNSFGVLLANVELEKIYTGKKIEVRNLYYKLGSYKLDANSKVELSKVISLLIDNPNLLLELGSHTDSRGKSHKNQELSLKRAVEARNYLLEVGEIAEYRLKARGYGESQIINKCKDGVKCSDREHAENRRTELKILGLGNTIEIKSLERMKNREFMDEDIAKLMNQKQIQVKDEAELAKIIAADKAETATSKKLMTHEDQVQAEKTKMLEKKKVIEEKKMKTKPESKKKTKSVVKDKVKTKKKIVKEKKVKLKIDFDDMPALDVIHNKFTTSTNGIKIIIHQGNEKLPKSHSIFTKHTDLEYHKTLQGRVYYMMGGYKTIGEAFSFYNSFISPIYKGSFVASFEDGIMTKIDQ